VKEAEYAEMAMEIYDQHFNPENVHPRDIPTDTETIVLDYNESFKHERIYCDPDLLHHHLVKIIGKRDENKVYISDINKEIVEENSKGD
jgi:hypothetical protein